MTRTPTQSAFDFASARRAAELDLLPEWVRRFRSEFESELFYFDFSQYTRTLRASEYTQPKRAERV